MNSLIRGVLWGLMLALSAALAQGSTSLNQISSVEVKNDSVVVTGRSKPNFTTFSLSEPPRLVVDISEAVFAKQVPAQLSGSGNIAMVKTATYGSDAATVARIIIIFRDTPDTDISVVNETILMVKIIGATSAAPKVAAVEPAPKAVLDEKKVETEIAESTEEEFEDGSDFDSEEEEPPAAKPGVNEMMAQQPPPAPAPSPAQEKEVLKAQVAAETQKEAEEKARKQAEAVAQQEAEKARAAEAVDRQTAERARAAEALAEKKRMAEEDSLRKAQEAEEMRQKAADDKRRQEEAALARRESVKAQANDVPISSKTKVLQFLGFKVEGLVSRLSFRTNEPVRFSFRQEDDKKWVVELENTLLGSPRNGLPLDTSFFDTPVLRVTPLQGSGRRLLAEISLKEPARVRTQQTGNEVYVEFERM